MLSPGCVTCTQVPWAGSCARLLLQSPSPPSSDWNKNPFIFLAYLECGRLHEVFPNSLSMLEALISPCFCSGARQGT